MKIVYFADLYSEIFSILLKISPPLSLSLSLSLSLRTNYSPAVKHVLCLEQNVLILLCGRCFLCTLTVNLTHVHISQISRMLQRRCIKLHKVSVCQIISVSFKKNLLARYTTAITTCPTFYATGRWYLEWHITFTARMGEKKKKNVNKKY
jgi:hypothetical protein